MIQVVCVKQVPDTETRVKVAADGRNLDPAGVTWVLNPYDEYAVEQALRVRDQQGGGEVVAVSVGGAGVQSALRNVLALGADRAIHLRTDATAPDPLSLARALAAELRGLGAGLVWFGKQAVDDDQAQVGPMTAELLGLPCATVAAAFALEGEKATVEREIEGGREVVELTLPAVVTAEKGLNEPRYASLKGIMAAKKKTDRGEAGRAGRARPRGRGAGAAAAAGRGPHRRAGPAGGGRAGAGAARGREGHLEEARGRRMSILVFIEQRDGRVRAVSREALGEATRLAADAGRAGRGRLPGRGGPGAGRAGRGGRRARAARRASRLRRLRRRRLRPRGGGRGGGAEAGGACCSAPRPWAATWRPAWRRAWARDSPPTAPRWPSRAGAWWRRGRSSRARRSRRWPSRRRPALASLRPKVFAPVALARRRAPRSSRWRWTSTRPPRARRCCAWPRRARARWT